MLVMSAGYLTLGARDESSEGLDKVTSIRYYARMRFLLNLLALLNAAPSPRVVSVLAADQEGQLYPEDFALKEEAHYSVMKAARAAASMNTLFFEEMRKQNPKVVFVHLYPGLVPNTALFDRKEHFGRLMRLLLIWVVMPVVSLFGYTVEESGERVLFAATNGRFRAVQQERGVDDGMEGIAVGTDGTRGTGVYLAMADSSTKEAPKVVKQMREEGVGRKLVDHTIGEFERIANL